MKEMIVFLMIYPAQPKSRLQGTDDTSMQKPVFASKASLVMWLLSKFMDHIFSS